MIVVASLPPEELSPNAREHWATKACAAKLQREGGWFLAHRAGLEPGMRVQSYVLHFYFADKRRRDSDNWSQRCKSLLDGIADRIGHDDSEWDFDGVRKFVDKDEPRVEVHLTMQSDA